jgi:hypothetical protein
MTQTLNIFRKDTRRFWPEIAISLGLVAAFALLGDWLWKSQDSGPLTAVAGLLAGLVPISWWMLITRAVQAERLVGDTQFWLTRPYRWPSLLGAKLLFIAVFVCVPLAVMQATLIARAGFSLSHLLPSLGFELLLLAGLLTLPILAMAAITPNIARLLLTLLGILLSAIALGLLAALLWNGHGDSILPEWTGRMVFLIAMLGLASAIGLEYALRRVWLARFVLLGTVLVIWLAVVVASHVAQAGMERQYSPVNTAQLPAQIALDTQPGKANSEETITNRVRLLGSREIPVKLNLRVGNVTPSRAVTIEAVRARFTSANGHSWQSDWTSQRDLPVLSTPQDLQSTTWTSARIWMPLDEYRRLGAGQVSAEAEVAVTEAAPSAVFTHSMSQTEFTVPGFGRCKAQPNGDAVNPGFNSLDCLSPLGKPRQTYISTTWNDGPCSAPEAGFAGTTWEGTTDPETTNFNLVPVRRTHVTFNNGTHTNERGESADRTLCPGRPVTFTTYQRVRQVRVRLAAINLPLPRVTINGNKITVRQ